MLRKLLDRISKRQQARSSGVVDRTGQVGREPTGDSAVPPQGLQPSATPSEAVQGEASADVTRGDDGPVDPDTLRDRVIENLKKVYDPEIPVNIYELGLIYEVKPDETGMVYVRMTLTAPNCPAAGILPGQIESQARAAEGVRDVQLDLVFDPPWTPERMSEAARLELGML